MQDKYLNGKSENETISILNKNAQIVYLFFKIEKTDSGSEKITLQEKKIVDGKLKSNPIFDENEGKTGDFVVSMTDANGKEIVKQLVEDPLNPTREVYGDKISRQTITLQNAEFSIRYSHSAEIQMVRIEKITNSGKQLLFTQKL
ncbi:hypothetical protein GCM10022217_41680 [Chryseobacterium ginsenosidimutans]